MNLQTSVRAKALANEARKEKFLDGFDLDVLIDLFAELIPTLIRCFIPSDGQEARDYITKRFDESKRDTKYRGYKRSLVRQMARRGQRAALNKQMRLSWKQATSMAFVTLDDIRTGDTSQASIVISEHFHDFQLI